MRGWVISFEMFHDHFEKKIVPLTYLLNLPVEVNGQENKKLTISWVESRMLAMTSGDKKFRFFSIKWSGLYLTSPAKCLMVKSCSVMDKTLDCLKLVSTLFMKLDLLAFGSFVSSSKSANNPNGLFNNASKHSLELKINTFC